MFKAINKIFGSDSIRRQLDSYDDRVQAINALEPEMHAKSDDELKSATDSFRERLAGGETLDDILVEAYAVVREVSIRTIGLRHFDVQLIGGMIIHEGTIVEMRTGEGKTLVATMPIYLNAMQGKGVHLVTVNDYLARRDARWMGPIFEFLGLSVGILQEASRTEGGRKAFLYDPTLVSVQEDVHELQLVDRKLAYAADVTYGTNNEFGFDYLRDNMARRLEDRSQRGHHFAILDEVDNILIDEARTPLIISGPSHEDPDLYLQMAQVVRQLSPEDLEVSERDRTVALTEIGENHVERILNTPLRDPDRPEDITPEQARMLGHLEQAMRAEFLFKRNKDYVVQGGRVIIVDDFTGRLMPGRRWSDGLHQAVEAKEGVKVRQENVTYATITLQNYFRMYEKLSGMTGTAITEAEEFNKIYGVDVIPLPTNLGYVASQPESDLVELDLREDGNKFQYFARKEDPESQPIFWRRKDYPDVVYRTEEAKLRAVCTEILSRHVIGQPLLVGTTSVELSEKLSKRLKAEELRRLAVTLVLRDAYFEKHEIPDEGMKVDELEWLYEPIDTLKQGDLRKFARELEASTNPTSQENLDRLRRILELEEVHLEKLDQVLNGGIPHNVLNAKKHDEESRIIADAGALGAVTIATNMAGRGVDIKLGGEIAEEVLASVNRVLRRAGIEEPGALNMEERLISLEKLDEEAIGIYDAEIDLFQNFMADGKRVKEVGGLHVLGSERHDARRIDNQLRGRAARQGDAGSSQFFLSLEDELMRLFGGSQVSNLMQRFNIDDAVPIAHNIVNKTIEQAQSRVEGANFDTRKHLLEYDDVLNQQREVFYTQRNRVFEKDELSDDIDQMLEDEVRRHIEIAQADPEGSWKLLAWLEEIQPTLNLQGTDPYPSFMLRLLVDGFDGETDPNGVREQLIRLAGESLEAQYQYLTRAVNEQLDRALTRLDDQVRQRLDLADLVIEGAELEENPPNIRQIVQQLEGIVGLRLQIEQANDLELDRLRDMLPDLVEASLGLRVWAAMIQTVEGRIGEKLPLEPTLPIPIDWDQAEESLLQAFQNGWDARVDGLLQNIARDLDQVLTDKELEENDILRLLIQMSYGQRTLFDRKTHQRKSISVARFSYAFYAAQMIETFDDERLFEEIAGHLAGAKDSLERLLGRSEINRLANTKIGNLDQKLKVGLESSMGSEFREIEPSTEVHLLPSDIQEALGRAIGQLILTEAHRALLLSVGDRLWVDYLTQIEALRTSIGLEAYGQRDPLVQYKSRAFDMFQQLLVEVRAGVVSRLFRIHMAPKTPGKAQAPVQSRPVQKSGNQPPGKKKRKRRRRR